MEIINTQQHTNTGLIVNPFGHDGAMRFTPIKGEYPGEPFILDAPAVEQLSSALDAEDEDTPKHESFVEIDALARRLFTALKARGIGFGVNAYDDLENSKKEVYRNDARVILLMEHEGVTEVSQA